MKGTLYCVGVGPGDPELLTLKALKIIRTCPVLAVPQSRTGVVTAQGILMKALDGCGITIDDKTVIAMDFPMTRDDQVLKGAHEKAARRLRDELDEGRDVCLITLGCPTVYATSIYVHRLIRQAGYATEIVPGVPSFCAVAAELQQPLCEKDEVLIVIPGNHKHRRDLLALDGSKVIMKPSGKLGPIQDELRDLQLLDKTAMIERCGLPGETVYEKAADAKDTGYFAVLLVK
ncbi:precorrin-2 C(20)-methyltransferase [Megasphaera elsdenii]|uniref:Precorrin-2 C(20)-methyltransferase n=1 Tax=Megasphaera elsdenii TaxID=907 RepID=A0A848ER94_MEGEL|nr:precorrin-2 C(20)-methyltransferase [Megasphaera elsdenii]NMK39491.1 precorrin-2 C(20)-methyltransferase [Megasphaera elsdenii]